ncbi:MULTISPECIES: hypothetical protein [Nocardiaceae]|nr:MULTISPECIES: hypothetical protein [Rhodococcus]
MLGATIITAQFLSMVLNGFAGLITSLFEATGRILPATITSTP